MCAKINGSIDSSLNSQSHYSIKKSAIILGLGTESVIAVNCDDKLAMMSYTSNVVLFIVEEKWIQWIQIEKLRKLNKKLALISFDRIIMENQGFAPFAVVATSGTTVIGAYDPIGPIADVCKKHDLWLHIDVREINRRWSVRETLFL